MTALTYTPMPTEEARNIQRGGSDENGMKAVEFISNGDGLPCRHCLKEIEAGDAVLLLSYKPFSSTQAFAEQGPIFLHKKECEAYQDTDKLPEMYQPNGNLLLRGYDKHEQIVYGTGEVTDNTRITEVAQKIFETSRVAFIHARSSTNNCFQFRIEKS